MTICNPSDNFCKAIGRKNALTYGIETLKREIRTAIWTEYKTVCNL